MSDHELQSLIVTKLTDLATVQAEISTDMRAVKEHLARLNGKVAAHEKEFGDVRVRLAERDSQCPLVEKVEDRLRKAEDYITAENATRKTSSAWMKTIWPFIWAAAGIFGLLVLQNAGFILKAFIH
jgi:predicted  nucleic acid-binding Zn-ribbon protein